MIKIYGYEYGYANAVPYKQSIFPGGEVFVRLENLKVFDSYTIVANIKSSMEVIELIMLTDAIRRVNPYASIHLTIPYLPYARQDRVCNPGESFSLEVMANLLKAQNYTSITSWDVHSIVAMKLLPEMKVISQTRLFIGQVESTVSNWDNIILVAPDKGAMNKVYAISNKTGSRVIIATKVRDPLTTKIISTEIEIDTDKLYERYLIVDDIADGGRTFVELAKVMRSKGVKHIELYVTHGIFSQGLSVFNGLIDKIYCPNPWIEFSELEKFNNG